MEIGRALADGCDYTSVEDRAWLVFSVLSDSDRASMDKIKSIQRALRLESMQEAFNVFTLDNDEEVSDIVKDTSSLTLLCEKSIMFEAMTKLKDLLAIYPVRSRGPCAYRYLPTLIKRQYNQLFDRYSTIKSTDPTEMLHLPRGVHVKAAFNLHMPRFTPDLISEDILLIETREPLFRNAGRKETFLFDLSTQCSIRSTSAKVALLPSFRAFAIVIDRQVRLYQGLDDDFIIVHTLPLSNEWVSLKMHANGHGDGFYLIIRIHNATFIYVSINRDIVPINLDGHIIPDFDFSHPDRLFLVRANDFIFLDPRTEQSWNFLRERRWLHSWSWANETIQFGVSDDSARFSSIPIIHAPYDMQFAPQMFFSNDLVIFNGTSLVILNNKEWMDSIILERLASSVDRLDHSLEVENDYDLMGLFMD